MKKNGTLHANVPGVSALYSGTLRTIATKLVVESTM